ncbi:hypothetical protein [Hyphomicrobium sp. DY-1]|uniref:hypothetical protein n=1 Tax=Hyphomicrobium sp. DY-1 TaxID=3075650 RepID=UPI0039C00675
MRFLFAFNRGFVVTMSVWAKVGGFIAAVTVTAAAQLWEYPYPRSLLFGIGVQCGLIALSLELWASSARATLSAKEENAVLPLEIIVAAPLLLYLAYLAYLFPSSLIPKGQALMACASYEASEICNAKKTTLSDDKVTE